MRKIVVFISKVNVLILLLSLSSCYYDEEIVIPEEVLEPVEDVSFANEIQPIFNEFCVACHPTVAAPDLTEGNSFNAITITDPNLVIPNDADGSELYQRLIGIGDLMPPSGSLSDADINLVKSWIEQGAKNN